MNGWRSSSWFWVGYCSCLVCLTFLTSFDRGGMGFSPDRHLSISPSFFFLGGGKGEGFSLRSWWRPARIIWGLIVNQHFSKKKEMGKKWALVSLEEKNESYFSLLKPSHPKSPYLCDGDFTFRKMILLSSRLLRRRK